MKFGCPARIRTEILAFKARNATGYTTGQWCWREESNLLSLRAPALQAGSDPTRKRQRLSAVAHPQRRAGGWWTVRGRIPPASPCKGDESPMPPTARRFGGPSGGCTRTSAVRTRRSALDPMGPLGGATGNRTPTSRMPSSRDSLSPWPRLAPPPGTAPDPSGLQPDVRLLHQSGGNDWLPGLESNQRPPVAETGLRTDTECLAVAVPTGVEPVLTP